MWLDDEIDEYERGIGIDDEEDEVDEWLSDVDTQYYQSEYIVYVYDERERIASFQMDALQ